MAAFSHRHLPVIENGQAIGVVSARHLPFGGIVAMRGELDQLHALVARSRPALPRCRSVLLAGSGRWGCSLWS
jgi:hypothetical protein